MTDKEKQSLKIRLGRRLSSDRPEVMEIVKEEITKTPKTISDILQRPQGEWLDVYPFTHIAYECSNCHIQMPIYNYYFCPNCGAKMKEEGANDES